MHPALAELLIRDHFFELDPLTSEGGFNMGPDDVVSGGLDYIGDFATNDLFGIDAELLCVSSVDEFVMCVGVTVNDEQRQVIGDEAELLFAIAQLLLGALSRGDVGEENTDSAILSRTNTEGVGVIPAIQGPGAVLEPDRLAAQGNVTIDLEPVLLVARHEFAHRFASGILQAGLLFERRIHLDKSVVHWRARGVKHDFDDAKTGVDGVEQRTIPLRRGLEGCTLPRKFRVGFAQRLQLP